MKELTHLARIIHDYHTPYQNARVSDCENYIIWHLEHNGLIHVRSKDYSRTGLVLARRLIDIADRVNMFHHDDNGNILWINFLYCTDDQACLDVGLKALNRWRDIITQVAFHREHPGIAPLSYKIYDRHLVYRVLRKAYNRLRRKL